MSKNAAKPSSKKSNNAPKAPAKGRRPGPGTAAEVAERAAEQERENEARWAAEDAEAARIAAAGSELPPAAPENSAPDAQISVDITAPIADASTHIAPESPAATPPESGTRRKRTVIMQTITATLAPKQRKSKNIVMFTLSGRKNTIQLPKTLFAEGLEPGFSFEITGVFAEPKAPAAPRKRLSKEERAALPKPTLAERAAAAEKRAAKLKAKLAEQQAAPAADL